jgi:glutamyl/glutaminyl-tRNA synthetase
VADDIDMQITHVIRGTGHLPNTPKHALLFDAFGSPRPVFAHLPTVLAPDGGKLSKRSGATGFRELRDAGYHPQGVVNYLSLLGWSPGGDREVLSKEELIEAMDLTRIGASDTAFDPEKLLWMSAQHIARMELTELAEAVAPFVDRLRYPLTDEELPLAVEVIRSRLRTFRDANDHLHLIFPSAEALESARKEVAGAESGTSIVRRVADLLSGLEVWNSDGVGRCVRQAGKDRGVSGPALFHPVRLVLFGEKNGPDLGKMMAALGRSRTLDRLERVFAPTN